MVRKLLAALFALALVGATAGVAQVSIGIGGQYLGFGGSDFETTDDGFGVEGNVMFGLGTSFKLGPSVQWSSHYDSFIDENISVLGILGEGRYMLGMGTGKATPYIAGRAGWVQASATVGGLSAKQSGFAGGGGVGVMIALSPALAFDLNGMFHAVSFGNAKVDGSEVPDSKTSGTALQVRAGINFKLGGGNGGM